MEKEQLVKTKKEKAASGTKEWASSNVNFIKGCIHDCRYCFAKSNAVKFKRKTADNWKNEEVNYEKLKKNFRKRKGTVMFPSSHDITPKHADLAIGVLEKLLKARNDVLIVSKPHLEVTEKLCNHFPEYKEQILFRFTIGSMDNDVLKFWEPNAPSFEERLASLKYAFSQGFKTSVSCEPALDGNTYELVQQLSPYVTDSIWIGLANRLKGNLKLNGHGDAETWAKADSLKKLQNKAWVFGLYEKLKDNSKIRWKDSCKKILQIDRPTMAGLDI
ncbi:MAG: radical SAM protein [Mariniphaga sp.]|nr:radical SAM protein [Mariniphaga sp.]